MSWFVFALICLLGWGFADLFYKKGTDENDPYSHWKIAVWVGLVMGAASLLLLPFSETLKSGGAAAFFEGALRYAPASLGYIVSMIIGYAGLRYLELSVVSPVQNASGAFSAVAMTLFFALRSGDFAASVSEATGFTFGAETVSEKAVNTLTVAGTVAVIGGVIALAVAEQRLSRAENAGAGKRYRYGALALLFPLLYCVFDTLGTAADGVILDESTGLGLGEIDVLILYGLTFFAAGVGAWIFLLIRTRRPYVPFAKSERNKAVAACCEEFGQVFYVFAMAARPVLAAPMIAGYCIVSVILSRLFLHEKLGLSRLLPVLAVIAGIVALGIAEGLGYLM